MVAPTRCLLANGQPPSSPGVYFGSWNAPDRLANQFAVEQSVVTVDNMLQATEACEQLEAPLLFFGPREYEGAVIGGHLLHMTTKAQNETNATERKEIESPPREPSNSRSSVGTHSPSTTSESQKHESDVHLAVSPPCANRDNSPPDAFWRNLAIASCSCCAFGVGLSLMTGLMVVLAFVFAREREPGESPSSNLLPSVEWVGHLPCIMTMGFLIPMAMIGVFRLSSYLYHRARRRLKGCRRHGRGARTRPGFGRDAQSSSILDAHRLTRHKLCRITVDSFCEGAPPWISLLLFLHWPVAILFDVLSSMIGGNKATVSPLRHIVDAPHGKYSWHGAITAFGERPTCRKLGSVVYYLLRGVFSISMSCIFGIFSVLMAGIVGGISMTFMGMRIVLSVAKHMLIQCFFLFAACSLHAIVTMSPIVEPRPCKEEPVTSPPTFRSKPSPLPPAYQKQPPQMSDKAIPTLSSSMHCPNIAKDVAMLKPTAQGRALKSKLEARKINPSSESSKPRAGLSDGSVLRRIMHLATWFIVDSGCTYHCHPMSDDLINVKPCSQHMIAADGSRHRITMIGDLPLMVRDRHRKLRRVILRNVRCVPTFTDTLVSVDQLWEDASIEARFAGTCAICVPTQAGHCAMELPFQRREGLFQWAVLPTRRSSDDTPCRTDETARCLKAHIHRAHATSHITALPPAEASAAVHRRLHINHEYLKRLPSITSDAPQSLKKAEPHSCEHCTEANATHLPHKGAKYRPSHVGRLVHGDIVGPFKRSHGRGFQYMLVLVDDHSRFLAVRLLRRKSEALSGVRSFVAELNAKLNRGSPETRRAVGTLHTDNAGEFLSREFAEFLDAEVMDQTLCPPHVHQLNGTAERAIRSIMQQVRSNLVASGAPITFWPYAALHAVDVLNRVRCPPGSDKSCYEMLTGEKPAIMDIMPFGCRAYAVKPTSNVRKTQIEPHAWVGINLGLEADTPGAYNVWLPDVGRKVVTSEVYFDEGLMPWRPKADQRIGPVLPTRSPPPDLDSSSPPNLSGPANTNSTETSTSSVDVPSSLPEAFDRATKGDHAKARASRKVLLLFSGPKRRPDGLAAFLARFGIDAVMIDADPENGGDASDDILSDEVYDRLMKNVKAGVFLAIVAAPPCSTFSISRFIDGPKGKGAPVVRTRKHIRGIPKVDPKHRRELVLANSIVARTAGLLAAAHEVGTQWIIENPADRGDPASHRIWLHDDHGPLWIMPEIIALARVCSASSCTFPMCAFSSPWQKYTTLTFSAGFEEWLAPLNKLSCEHASHAEPAGGQNTNGEWQSARAAAYPADFNFYLARAIAALASPNVKPTPLARSTEVPKEDSIETRARELRLPAPPNVAPNSDKPDSKPQAPNTRGFPNLTATNDRNILEKESRSIDFTDVTDDNDPPPSPGTKGGRTKPEPFKRTLGAYPLRNRLRALLAKPSQRDPKTRSEAMAQDSEGWLSSERKEINNHLTNKTFEIIDRSEVPSGRKLVRWTWVYKWKRDGTQKSRLCVQGCSMIPGVDFDQTFCATLRSSSLRVLGAIAAKLGLRLRRWDFTAAYLQGTLEEGEVIYCCLPQGYDVKGKDGFSRVCRVIKPCYGMSQAGRRWQRSLFPWIIEWNNGALKQTYADSCVFYCRQTVKTPDGERTEWLLMGAYVDDLCILYSHDDEYSLYRQFTRDLQSRWAVEDEGDVSDLLGIDISVENKHVCLRQSNYIDRLASEFFANGVPPNMQKNTLPHQPDLPQFVLEAVDSKEPVDPTLLKRYQSLVGALLYCATNTRPDVAYAVGLLCRAMSCPTPDLLAAAERVLAYLIRNKDVGLRYAASERPLFGMTDSDWSVRHSTSGWVFMLSSAAISWGSKRQPCVALSSCEAEIIAASEATKEAIYLKRFATELESFDGESVELFEDNKGARDLAYNPEHHSRTKHIDRRHFFVREMVENGELVVPYVKSDDNLADFFTKPLSAKRFFSMRDKIMNWGPTHV